MEPTVTRTILLDVAPGPGEAFERSFLTRNGYEVVACHGPLQGELCPLLRGDGCSMFEGAHGVVFELDLDRPQHRAIVERYRALAGPDLPIRVVTSPAQAQRYAAFLGSVRAWPHLPDAADLDGFAAEIEALDRM
ncbi:MAG: hypothetical protein ACHQNA_02425 [Acidimicrobiales bacterium]